MRRLNFILILLAISFLHLPSFLYGQDNCGENSWGSSLIAHFPFDGNAHEALGTSFNGTVNGAALVNGYQSFPASAYSFDGTNHYIHIGDHFDLDQEDFTISCWVYVDEFKGEIPGTSSLGGWIINKGVTIFGNPSRAGYALDARKIEGENYFNFFVGGQNDKVYSASASGLEENKWYSLMAIKEKDSIYLYVDNQLKSSSSIPSEINVNTNIPLVFGSIDKLGNDPEGTTYFHGKIDEIHIFKKALSSEERKCLSSSCPTPYINLGNDFTHCSDGPLTLNAFFPNSSYQWQDGSTSPEIIVSQTGTYWVKVENECGSAIDTISILFSEPPSISLGEDQKIKCLGDSFTFNVHSPGAKIEWQDGSTNSFFTATEIGTYWVKVENECGMAVDSVSIGKEDQENIKLPNIFTPNEDSFNQFYIIDERLLGSRFSVYQRTGKMVYQSDHYLNNWDGDNLTRGTYYYTIENPCMGSFNGWIHLIY